MRLVDRDADRSPLDAPPIVTLEDVCRDHHADARVVRALGPVTVAFHPGEFTAIMGPSGSGKSTLLAIAGALDTPTSGRVRVGDVDLSAIDARSRAALRRRRIGFVFQDLNLLPGLTAQENVSLPLELDGAPREQARREAAAALESVGMAAFAARFPDDLSGGEQQRVAIARAVVGPRLALLADEPTGALDSLTGERVMRLLRRQRDRGRAVVVVTHDAAHAAWADRVLHLRDGRFVELAATTRADDAPGGRRDDPAERAT